MMNEPASSMWWMHLNNKWTRYSWRQDIIWIEWNTLQVFGPSAKLKLLSGRASSLGNTLRQKPFWMARDKTCPWHTAETFSADVTRERHWLKIRNAPGTWTCFCALDFLRIWLSFFLQIGNVHSMLLVFAHIQIILHIILFEWGDSVFIDSIPRCLVKHLNIPRAVEWNGKCLLLNISNRNDLWHLWKVDLNLKTPFRGKAHFELDYGTD